MINKVKDLLFKYKSQILYLFFGGVTTLINIIVFFLLNSIFKINYQVSNVIAWFICVAVAYITNKIWVFESKTKNKKDLARETISFLIARILTLVMEFILLYLLVEKLQVLEIISKIIVNVFVIVANYFLSKLIIFNSNVKFNAKKVAKVLIPIAIIFIIMSVLSYQFETFKYGYDKYFYGKKDNAKTSSSTTISAVIANNAVLEQKVSIKENAKYIVIKFIDTDYGLSDTYKLKVIDSDKNVVLEQSITNKLIYKNEFILDIGSIKPGTYTININYIQSNDNISIFTIKSEKNKLLINGIENDICLDMYVYYKNNLKYIIFYSFMIISFIITCGTAYFLSKQKFKIENKFLILSIPIFILYVFVIPINNGHDELYHWHRVFEISEGYIVSDINNRQTGAYLPDGFSIGYSVTYKETIEAKEKIDYNKKSFYENGTMAVYNPLQYYPQLLGVKTGKNITNNPYIIYYIARLFNMIFCIFFLYLAIKKIPYMKKTLFVIAFIPIAIEGFTTLSGDGILIAMAYYFISYIMYLREEDRLLSKKDQIILFALSILISSSKLVYVPIIGLVLLLSKNNFKSNRERIIKSLILIITSISVNLVWLKIASKYLATYTMGKSSIATSMILSNPFEYFQMFMYSIQDTSTDLIMQMFGKYLLWDEVIKNKTLVPLIMLTLTILTLFNEKSKIKKKSLYELVIQTIIVVVIIVLIYTSLFIQWTDIGSDYIYGVQGRYFLPILPIICIIIYNLIKKRLNINDELLGKIIIIGCALANYIVLVKILLYYI